MLVILALLFACHGSNAITAQNIAKIEEINSDARQINWRGKRLNVTFGADGSFQVRDSNTNKTWHWEKLEGLQIKSILKKNNGFIVQIVKGEFPFMANFEISPNEDSIRIRLSGDKGKPVELFKFPGWSISAKDHLVLPMSEGLLIPPGDVFLLQTLKWKRLFGTYNISGHVTGISMPWIGLTDFDSGLMILTEDAVDAQFEIKQLSDGLRVGVVWLHIMGKFGKERNLRLIFPDKGGYVAMAKAYRLYLREKGELISLDQKASQNGKVRKLAGALDIWLKKSKERSNQAITEKDDTLDKAFEYLVEKINPKMCLVSVEFNTGRHFNYEKKREFAERIHKTGYLSGRYISYYDIYPKEEVKSLGKSYPEDQYWAGYPQEVCKLADGSFKKGFLAATKRKPEGTADLEEGTVQGYYRNSKFQWEWVKRDLPRIKDQANFDAIFYDVAGSAVPMECYNPDYLLTREEDIGYRKKYLQFLVDQGYIIGTENGTSWVVPVVHYLEGIGTIRRAPIKGVRVGVTPFETTPLYEGVNLSEYYRIPLFQLVFHDAVFSTFRWNYTPDRYKNRSLWKKHDLFILLYGYMPIFVEDYETLKERGNLLKDSITPILDWHSKIGMDEMVDHRYLTKERKVQESRFSSGWAVVVNFGDQKFKTDSGKEVAPMNYLTYKWK